MSFVRFFVGCNIPLPYLCITHQGNECMPAVLSTQLVYIWACHSYIPWGHRSVFNSIHGSIVHWNDLPDSKVHGSNMGPVWGRQDVQHVYADMHIDHVSTTLEMDCYKFLWHIIIEQQKYIWLYIWNGQDYYWKSKMYLALYLEWPRNQHQLQISKWQKWWTTMVDQSIGFHNSLKHNALLISYGDWCKLSKQPVWV